MGATVSGGVLKAAEFAEFVGERLRRAAIKLGPDRANLARDYGHQLARDPAYRHALEISDKSEPRVESLEDFAKASGLSA